MDTSKILEAGWAIFVGLGWWALNRVTQKIDSLESQKADATETRSAISKNSMLIHETDKRIDEIQHTTVPRQEYKSDIGLLHTRLNDIERIKQDKVQDIRIVENAEDKKKGK